MIWRHILNSNKLMARNIDEAAKITFDTGYKFMAWNGIIYFIDDKGSIHDTGLKVDDIEK